MTLAEGGRRVAVVENIPTGIWRRLTGWLHSNGLNRLF